MTFLSSARSVCRSCTGAAPVGLHRLDLFVAEQIVVELKSVKAIENVHFAVTRSYLRALGREHGLILNFAKVTLEIKRVIASD